MARTSSAGMYIVAHNASRILGGGEIGTALLLAGLQDRGHRVLMLCRDAQMAERIAAYGIPTSVQHVGGDVMLPDAVRLAARLRREQPDAVILTTFKKILLTGMACRMARVPFVVQRIVLQGDTPGRGMRYRFAFKHLVDAIALNADALRAPFLKGARTDRMPHLQTILDGVRAPVQNSGPGAVRRELSIPEGAVVIGTIARLAQQKRLDRLLRAVALMETPVHCLIAGEGSHLEPTRRLAAELGIADRIHLPGFRSDIGDVLAALDIFVISSDREGMANAMLEAMTVGVPVVSTDVSGAREALGGDGTAPAGVVVPFDDRALACAIDGLAADPAQRRVMGAAARARAADRFGAGRFLDDWEHLLRRAGNDGARSEPGGSV